MGSIITKILLGATTFFSGYVGNDIVENPSQNISDGNSNNSSINLTTIAGYAIVGGVIYFTAKKYLK